LPVRASFSILKIRGDGSLERGAGTATLQAANERVTELAEYWPGSYVILDEETGDRFTVGGETRIN